MLLPGTEESAIEEFASASGMETGSAQGSGDYQRERDEEVRRILEMQTSIPYKKRKNCDC